jgi:hypothetical protein
MNEALRIIRTALDEVHEDASEEHCAYLDALLDAEQALLDAGAA